MLYFNTNVGATLTAAVPLLLRKSPGLSPRVRGNRLLTERHQANHGSIPVCAGEPTAIARFVPLRRVYPRVCGGTVNASFDALWY